MEVIGATKIDRMAPQYFTQRFDVAQDQSDDEVMLNELSSLLPSEEPSSQLHDPLAKLRRKDKRLANGKLSILEAVETENFKKFLVL